MGGIGIWQLVIILVIVLVIFGAKRLRNIGSDLGASVKGFRQAMKEDDGGDKAKDDNDNEEQTGQAQERVIEADKKEDIIEGEVVKEKDRA